MPSALCRKRHHNQIVRILFFMCAEPSCLGDVVRSVSCSGLEKKHVFGVIGGFFTDSSNAQKEGAGSALWGPSGGSGVRACPVPSKKPLSRRATGGHMVFVGWLFWAGNYIGSTFTTAGPNHVRLLSAICGAAGQRGAH